MCWVLGTFKLIPEADREEEHSRQGLSLDKGPETGLSQAHRKQWKEASMAATQRMSVQVVWEEVRPGAGDR